MNTIFDWKRFVMMLRWDVISYWKQMMTLTLGITFSLAMIFVGQLMSLRSYVNMPETLGDLYRLQTMGFVDAFLFIFIGVMPAFLFSNMKTKETRLAFLIQPASNLEKFIVRLLHVTAGALACYFAALLLADLIQFVFSLFITPGYSTSVTWNFLDNMLFDHEPRSLTTSERLGQWLVVSVGVWTHSLYLLGGSFFRRRAWLLTTSILFVLGIFFISTGLSMFEDFIDTVHYEPTASKEYTKTMAAVSAAVLNLITPFNYWASYKLFTRMQVINNKWINI